MTLLCRQALPYDGKQEVATRGHLPAEHHERPIEIVDLSYAIAAWMGMGRVMSHLPRRKGGLSA